MSSKRLQFISTCDLYDKLLDESRVPSLQWKSFGGKTQFCGLAVTIKCFEDNSRLKELVETPGENRVLVVDGGGSLRHALMGDMLAEHATKNQWQGVIVHGCVRDVKELSWLDLGVMALGCTPRKSVRRGEGTVDECIRVGDVECKSGDLVFADENGVLFVDRSVFDKHAL